MLTEMIRRASVLALLGLAALGPARPAAAGGQTILFNDSRLGWITVGSFDWNVGNALADGAIPLSADAAAPTRFTTHYQAALTGFNDPNGKAIGGTGLNADYEVTVVARLGETGYHTPQNPDGDAFTELDQANFALDPAAPTYLRIYLDGNPNADPLAGTGFDDGRLIMSGTIVSVGQTSFTVRLDDPVTGDNAVDTFPLDGFVSDDYPGILTLRGNGAIHQLLAAVPYANIDAAYVDVPTDAVLTLVTSSQLVLPFFQQDPSAVVGGIAPTFGVGNVNGFPTATGEPADFLFQIDANSSFSLSATKNGYKFNDLNGNGALDAGEPGLAGWTIYIDVNANGALDAGEPSTATDASGYYEFAGLQPGTYVFREVQQEGWTCTYPSPCFYQETLVAGQVSENNLFGNHQAPEGCRMTAGNVQTGGYDPLTDTWDGTFTTPLTFTSNNTSTGGGQIGAKTAAQPQPYGEWTHHLMPNNQFVFHMGTASGSPGTEIYEVVCSDCLEGNCSPARPASCQQIDWSGIGEFQTLKGGIFPFPGYFQGTAAHPLKASSKKNPRDQTFTLHWAEGHVFDGGEPAANNPNDPNAQLPGDALCTVLNTLITDQFGDAESGGAPARYFDAFCECPDFYRLKVYNGVAMRDLTLGADGQLTAASIQKLQAEKAYGPIYVGGGYVDPKGGNFQLHPPTGYQLNQ